MDRRDADGGHAVDTDPDADRTADADTTTGSLDAAAAALTDAARRTFGGSLRAVLVYDADAEPPATVHYVREDVADAYDGPPREVAAEVARDDVFASIDREWDGRNPLGTFRASVRIFEDGVVVRVVSSPGRGVSMSVEHDAFPKIQAVLDDAERHLRS